MNARHTPHAHPLWHPSEWSAYLSRWVHPHAARPAEPPVHLTRRQVLLAEQERRRQERRAHMLEQLNHIKPH